MIKLRAAQQELEQYFANKYAKKYAELGGYFFIKGHKDLNKSPMQKYFSSGKYKELKDLHLENLWKQVKKREFIRNIVFLAVIVLFYALTHIYGA